MTPRFLVLTMSSVVVLLIEMEKTGGGADLG